VIRATEPPSRSLIKASYPSPNKGRFGAATLRDAT
jgi:hypothetical protein